MDTSYYKLICEKPLVSSAICVKGIRKPTCKEATEFFTDLVKEYGPVVKVQMLDEKTAREEFNLENEDNWPIFGTKELPVMAKIKAILEKEIGEHVNVLSVDIQNGEYYAELEFWSNAGEDFIFTVWFDGTWKDFVRGFWRNADTFDPDDHAEMWVSSRGKNGVPSSIRELINDADDIKKTLEDWAEELQKDKDKYNKNWEAKDDD